VKKRIDKAKTSIKDFFANFKMVVRRPDMVVLPGNLAFYFFLAIIPIIALISYGASILNLSTDYLYNFMAKSFSSEIATLILGVNLSNNTGIHFFIISIIGFYIASNGANSIITTSNAIYGIKNKSWGRRRLKAFGMTLLIVILLIFMLIVPVFGNTIIELIKDVYSNTKITNKVIEIFNLLKGPVSWLIIFIIIKILYSIAPDRKRRNRVINYGAVFTTVCWILGTWLFSAYVTNIADYSALFGGLASIVVLMIWVNFLSYIFTIGMALNCQKDEINLTKTGTIENE
jgi:membrane protein